MYAITNAYDIRDALKDLGATFDPARKAWMLTDAAYAKADARTQSYGMRWVRGWDKAVKTRVEG